MLQARHARMYEHNNHAHNTVLQQPDLTLPVPHLQQQQCIKGLEDLYAGLVDGHHHGAP